MEIFQHSSDIQRYISEYKQKGKTIGFVPTMGALHEGHISLVQEAANNCDIVICSIFVNPTQFNEKSDFSNYPIDHNGDIELLEKYNCNVVFIPQVNDIYPPEKNVKAYSFPAIDKMMEGEHRPGHFAGVAQVVKRFFDIITPDFAYFGLKDYQQYLVIKTLAEKENISTIIVGCPTIRENSGLAMSSRNRLLSEEEKNMATEIYRILNNTKENLTTQSVSTLKTKAIQRLEDVGFIPEYFEITDGDTLLPIQSTENHTTIRAFVAAKMGSVRLIDNIELV